MDLLAGVRIDVPCVGTQILIQMHPLCSRGCKLAEGVPNLPPVFAY